MNTGRSVRTRLHILVLVCAFGFTPGCDRATSGTAAVDKSLVPEVHGDFYLPYDWYPAADGSIYILDNDGNLWCVRGVEAVKVRKVEAFSQLSSVLNPTVEGWKNALCEKRVREAREEAAQSAWDEAYVAFKADQQSEWDEENRYPPY